MLVPDMTSLVTDALLDFWNIAFADIVHPTVLQNAGSYEIRNRGSVKDTNDWAYTRRVYTDRDETLVVSTFEKENFDYLRQCQDVSIRFFQLF